MPLKRGLVLLVVAAGSCESPPSEVVGWVQGVVVDARDDEPVAGARVTVVPGERETRADEDGAFRFELPAAPYVLQAEVEGRQASEPTEALVERGQVSQVVLRIPDLPSALTLQLPVGIVQAGYGKLVTIDARVTGPEGEPITYTWRQLWGPDLTASFVGQGTARLTFRTPSLQDLVRPPQRFGPIAISAEGQGEYGIELEVSDGTHTVRARTAVRSGSISGGWPRLATGVDAYFHCGDVDEPHFTIESQTPCRDGELDCTPVEIEGADTCTPRLRGHFSGSFFLVEHTSGRRVLYEVGRWFGDNDQTSGCGRPDCHASEAERWAATPHATMFRRGIEGELGPDYEPACARCHTLGNDVAGRNHGFDDVAFESDWRWPERLEAGNWDDLPDALQGLSNVQCSSCHGPSLFWKGYGVGVCAQCHDAPPRYTKVAEWRASPMSHFVRSLADDDPALRDGCTRCHSAQGALAVFTAQLPRPGEAPRDPGAVQRSLERTRAPSVETVEPITCIVCHDVKSANPSMLRVFGGQELPSREMPIDAGASAMCLRCHNAQVDPRDPDTLARRLAPMQGAQADVFYGSGAIGVEPRDAGEHALVAGCVDCHMATPSDPALVGAAGGHTFLARSFEGRANDAACSGCHEVVSDFDVPALGDHDGDGQVESSRAEFRGLVLVARAALSQAIATADLADCGGQARATGFDEIGGVIALVSSGGEPLLDCAGVPVTFGDSELALHRAAFDLLLMERDRSEGLHAPRYAAEVLQQVITSLVGDAAPPWDPAVPR